MKRMETCFLSHDENGFTLVELMAGLTISLILLLTALGFFTHGTRTCGNYLMELEDRRRMENLSEFLYGQLSYGMKLERTDRPRTARAREHVIEFTKDGKVLFDGASYFEETVYQKRRFYCRCWYTAGEKHLLLMVEVTEMGPENELSKRSRMVIPLFNSGELIGFPSKDQEREEPEAVFIYYTQPPDPLPIYQE